MTGVQTCAHPICDIVEEESADSDDAVFCNKCGAKNAAGSEYCNKCGAKIELAQ